MRFKRSWTRNDTWIDLHLSSRITRSLDASRMRRRNWKKKKKRKKISSIFIHRGSCCWICSKERKVSLENRMEWVGLRGKGSFLIYSRYEKAFAFYIYIIRSSYSQVFLSPSICQHVRRYDMPWRQIWPRFHVWRTCKIATISPTVNRLSQWRQFS